MSEGDRQDMMNVGSTVVALRREARRHGWSLALHGSCVRDLDFVAVPWRFNAVSTPSLIAALNAVADSFTHQTVWRPHGRIGFLLARHSGRPFVDVSVVDPRNANKEAWSDA